MTTNIPVQTAPVAGQVVVYQSNTECPPSSLNRKAALITGYMQIGLAITSLGFGVACASARYFQGVVGVPIWGALGFYLVAGILGVIAGHSKGRNECAIVGCLVMSILATITAAAHVIAGGVMTSVATNYEEELLVLNVLTILIGLIEFVTAIVASVFMCSGATCCCGQQTANANTTYVVQPGQVQGYSKMQEQQVGQPQGMGQPDVMGQPQQNIQPPTYTEHETKEVP